MLPICAFEQHRGHHRLSTDFEGVLIEAKDVKEVVQPTYFKINIAGSLKWNDSPRDWSEIGFSQIATLNRDIVRSLQNEAYLVPCKSHEPISLIPECKLSQQFIYLLVGENSEAFGRLWAKAPDTEQSEFKARMQAWLTALDECFSTHEATVQVLNHYPSTNLLPALNKHLIFAEPADLEPHGFACDAALFADFKTGENIIPILPALFLEQWRNNKGRQKRHEVTQHLFEIACAFSVTLDREATEIFYIQGERQMSAANKREAVVDFLSDACRQFSSIDGRGETTDHFVEQTVLRLGRQKLSQIDSKTSYIDPDVDHVEVPHDMRNSRERFIFETTHGRLSNLSNSIRLFFDLATRSSVLETEGRRALRRGQVKSDEVKPNKDEYALSVIGAAPYPYLETLADANIDLWTRLALDFKIDVSELYPALGYFSPQLQAAIAVADLLEAGPREIDDTDERIERLALYQLFQTENSEVGLPAVLRSSRAKLRKTIRVLGLEAQAKTDPRQVPTVLPITETDLAKIRKKREADEKGAE